jgi:hypothetical protein
MRSGACGGCTMAVHHRDRSVSAFHQKRNFRTDRNHRLIAAAVTDSSQTNFRITNT